MNKLIQSDNTEDKACGLDLLAAFCGMSKKVNIFEEQER